MKSRSLLLIVLGLIFITPVVQGITCDYSVDPDDQRYLAGNPNCSDVQDCSDCIEYKLEGEELTGGTHTDGTITVTLTVRDYNEEEWLTFDWISNIPVTAVIVKGGKVTVDEQDYFAYVYKYGSPRTSDECLSAPSGKGISHITFCYVVPQIAITVNWYTEGVSITQPIISEWAASPTEYTLLFGNLRVSVTATVDYDLGIYYTVNSLSDFSPPSGATPLSFEYGTGSGTWTSIPPEGGTMQTLPAPSEIGTNREHTYPMRVDLAQLGTGDQTAGDSITFQVHVVATASGI